LSNQTLSKIIVSHLISLDGFFEGPDKELDWPHVDDEFHQYAGQQLNDVDTILFVRVACQIMEAY
jgi:hypothetical protein